MQFMTRDEVAKYLRVNARTVERWLKKGFLKGYKLGDSKTSLWRIPKIELDRFLKGSSNNKKRYGKRD